MQPPRLQLLVRRPGRYGSCGIWTGCGTRPSAHHQEPALVDDLADRGGLDADEVVAGTRPLLGTSVTTISLPPSAGHKSSTERSWPTARSLGPVRVLVQGLVQHFVAAVVSCSGCRIAGFDVGSRWRGDPTFGAMFTRSANDNTLCANRQLPLSGYIVAATLWLQGLFAWNAGLWIPTVAKACDS